MDVSPQVVRTWAADIFVECFSCQTTLEDEQLEMELESGRGKHPKWISLIHDENFWKEAKGKPNLTLDDVVKWVKDTYDVEVQAPSVPERLAMEF